MATADDELWQAYDEQGLPIPGRGLTKQQAWTGLLHGAAHVWIWRVQDGKVEVLLQKRAAEKKLWPEYFDVSAAGHINAGETSLQAAVRELSEEIGVTAKESALKLLFVHNARIVQETEGDADNVFENEFQWVYSLHLPDTVDLRYAHGEVETANWVLLDDLDSMIDGETDMSIAPHGSAYFTSLLSQLDRLQESRA